MVMVVNNIVYSKVAKWVDLKRSHHTQKIYNYGDVCELDLFFVICEKIMNHSVVHSKLKSIISQFKKPRVIWKDSTFTCKYF